MTIELTTCKLVFKHGAVTFDTLIKMLNECAGVGKFHVDNFCPTSEIGANKVTFAVVSIPVDAMAVLYSTGMVEEIDQMLSSSIHKKSCDGGDCCKKHK